VVKKVCVPAPGTKVVRKWVYSEVDDDFCLRNGRTVTVGSPLPGATAAASARMRPVQPCPLPQAAVKRQR